MVRFYKAQTPFSHEWDWCDFEANQTIAEVCGAPVRAWVDGREVSDVFIERARLKPGVTVHVRPIPRLPAALAIAASVAAGAGAAASGWATAGYLALSVGLSVASSLIARSQLENPGSRSGGFDRLNALTGSSNKIASFEPIPKLMGRMRYYPPIPMTAPTYTESAGSDQWLRMMIVLNDGLMEIGGHIVGAGYPKITQETVLESTLGQRPVRVGETDIAEFESEWEIGTPDQMTLYTDQIIEQNPAWTTESDYSNEDDLLNTDNLTTTRTTDTGARQFSIDLTGQLYAINSKGEFTDAFVNWQVEWRLSGSTDVWSSDTFQQRGRKKTSRKTFLSPRLPNDGTQAFDVRLTRVSTQVDDLDGTPSTSVTWNALRTIRDRKAFIVPGVVVMNLRIKATDQLDGTLDKLNILGTAVQDVYENGAWVKKATRAHAWALAAILTDQSNGEPLALDDLNTSSFVAWNSETEAAGRYYDTIYDNNVTTLKRIQEVTSAGRATWTIDPDTTIRVVLDTVQTLPKMVVSPYNSFDYRYHLLAFDPPHAYRVRYLDSETWEPTERIVYDDGYGPVDDGNIKGATLYENIDAPGCTNADQAWKHGRYFLAVERLRGIEKHTFVQELKHYHYGRGDMIALAHDVILVGLGWGRIQHVTTNAGGDAVTITTDSFLPMPEPTMQYGVQIQRLNGDVTTINVTNEYPGTRTVTLAEPVANLGFDDHVTFGETGRITTDVKVATIRPRGNKQAEITCEPAAPDILDAETGLIPAPVNDITARPDPTRRPPAVPTINSPISDATVAIRNDDGSLSFRLFVPVTPNSGYAPTDRIIVQMRPDTGLPWEDRIAQSGVAIFDNVDPQTTVDIRAKAISSYGVSSPWTPIQSTEIVGKLSPPPNVTAFTAVFESFAVNLSWDPSPALDLRKYEVEELVQGTWLRVDYVDATSIRVPVLPVEGQTTKLYRFRVRALDTGLRASGWTETEITVTAPPGPVVGYQFDGPDFILTWTPPTVDFTISEYRVYRAGQLVDSPKATQYRTKADWSGTETWSVATADVADNEGAAVSVDVAIVLPSVTQKPAQVIDNNVLLYWTGTPGSLPIERYVIRKGGVEVGSSQGSFTTIFESEGGTYSYEIIPVDTAGNEGAVDGRSVTVNEPPDFNLLNEFSADFTGVKSNAVVEGAALVLPVADETVAQHFDNNAWTTPQNQIDAGFPIYAQPSPANGWYQDEYDCGTVIPSSRIEVTATTDIVAGDPAVSVQIETRASTGDSWTVFDPGQDRVYATNFRYIRVTLSVSTDDGTDLARIRNLQTVVSTKLKSDQGTVEVTANPTSVSFNKSFIDIDSIVATLKGTTSGQSVIYDFVDVPNPTGFDLYVFDSSGNPTTGTVSWQARGS